MARPRAFVAGVCVRTAIDGSSVASVESVAPIASVASVPTATSGAVFHSTALLVSGAFLLAVAAAGYIVRYLGGDWGRALQIEFIFGGFTRHILDGVNLPVLVFH